MLKVAAAALCVVLALVPVLQLGLAANRMRRARSDFREVVWAYHRAQHVQADFSAFCHRWGLVQVGPLDYQLRGSSKYGKGVVEQRIAIWGVIPVERRVVLEATHSVY